MCLDEDVASLQSIEDIRFRNEAPLDKNHPRILTLAQHQKKLDALGFDFFSYRELFERFVCESLIATGGRTLGNDLVELTSLPLGPIENRSMTVAAQIMGGNLHGNLRYSSLAGLFSLYDSHAAETFFQKRLYLETEYFRQIEWGGGGFLSPSPHLLGLFRSKRAQTIVRARIGMLEKFRGAGSSLVPLSKSSREHHHFHYYDIPWAIDYFGYTKLRDGAHRRATLFYLGQKKIPTLVVNFRRLEAPALGTLTQNDALIAGFETFRHIVSEVSQLEVQ